MNKAGGGVVFYEGQPGFLTTSGAVALFTGYFHSLYLS